MQKTDKRRKLTEAQKREIVRRRASGEAVSVLAHEYGVSTGHLYHLWIDHLDGQKDLTRSQVRHGLRLLGLEPARGRQRTGKYPPPPAQRGRRGKLAPQQRETIFTRLAKGETQQALASEFGVTRQAISAMVHRKAKRPKPAVLMEMHHLYWLEARLKSQPTRTWEKEEVRELLRDRFGENFNLRCFSSHLKWLGVRIGGERHSRRKQAEHLKARAAVLEAEKQTVLKAVREHRLPSPLHARPYPGKPSAGKRGRPRKGA